jgi:hypothetical protein
MDPTLQIKTIFGDLLMQIAVLQAELRQCQQELEQYRQDDKNT